MGLCSGSKIKLFQRFFEYWNSIVRSSYESGLDVDSIASALMPVIRFIQHQLTAFHPRDDYRELLQLSLLFFGAEPNGDVHIQAPGACQRARWMAKLIYSLKIYLFRSQFRLTKHGLSSLGHFTTSVLKVYLKAWFTSPCAPSAPQNDLLLLGKLESYKKTKL